MPPQSDPERVFPEAFLFGVATADHQCEAYEPRWEDVRDVWERRPGLVGRGRATDFWARYPEDVELARRLGCRAFRFSIAWSRVEPRAGEFDDEAFRHYREVVACIRGAGMEPLLTLHHFTWPLHVEARGGMIGDDFPHLFRRYAAEVAARLGREVRYWMTFNEPTQLTYGYVKPWWERDYFVPPGLPQGSSQEAQMLAVGALMRNLFVAHTWARQEIKAVNPDAQVGANPLLLGLPTWLQRLVDRNVTRLRDPRDLVRQGRGLAERRVLDRGGADVVVATLTRTQERERQVFLSEPYFVAGQTLLVPAASPAAGPADLAGKRVAVVKTSTAEQQVHRLFPSARVQVVLDHATALTQLDANQSDAILSDDTILRGLSSRHPGRYRLIGGHLTSEPYVAAVTRGEQALLDRVNAAIQRFKRSGAWAASYAAHLGAPVPEPPGSAPTDLAELGAAARQASARARSPLAQAMPRFAPNGPADAAADAGPALCRILKRGYLRVAVKGDVPGFGSRDPRSGLLVGLEVDLAREIARELFGDPSRVRFRPVATRDRIPLLRSLLRLLEPLLTRYAILSTALTSNWWHLGMAGKLPAFLCPPECVGKQDFIGFDYYWGTSALRLDRIQQLVEAGLGRFDRAPVWPSALYGLLRYHARLFPNLPLLVVENGSVEVADGVDRVSYLRHHLREVQRALQDGTNVIGYNCWSITSNREWGFEFSGATDFGLYHVALDADPTLERQERPAALAYKQIIAQRAVPAG